MKTLLLAVSHSFIPEAKALFARMSPAPTDARKRLINTAMKTMKATGALALLQAFYMPAAATAQAAALNWVSSSFTITAVNSPTFTADRGWLGDGATSYLDTGYLGSGLTPPSTAAGVWINVDGADGGNAMGSLAGLNIRPNDAGVLRLFTAVNETLSVANGLGFSGFGRTGAVTTIQKNAAQSAGSSSAGGLTTGGDYLLLAGLTGLGPGPFTASRIAAAFIGPGLTPTQLASVEAAMSAYLSAVGGQ